MSRVVGYFDTATMLGQLGLQAHITPADMPGIVEFGIANHVTTGRDARPGAFTVTWIEIDDEHYFDLVDATTAIVMEQLGNRRSTSGAASPPSVVATSPSARGPTPTPHRPHSTVTRTRRR